MITHYYFLLLAIPLFWQSSTQAQDNSPRRFRLTESALLDKIQTAPQNSRPDTAQSDEEILGPVQFSHPGGFYRTAFELTLTHPDSEAVIVYTLDGSRPDIDNLDGAAYIYKNQYPHTPGSSFGDSLYHHYTSHVYTGPIRIYDRSPEADKLTRMSSTNDANPSYFPTTPVRKGTAVQARAFKAGASGSPSTAHSYFVFSEGNAYEVPVISLHIQENLLFGYGEGIYTAGIEWDAWRLNNPDEAPAESAQPANFWRRGSLWEYPAQLEVFEAHGGRAAINQGIGFRIHGGWARRLPLKNMRLYARNRHDEARPEIQHVLFAESAAHANKADHERYKRLMLRSMGHNAEYLPDVVSHKLMQPVYEGVGRVRPAVHFINGEYWGITTFRDRFDQYHFAYHYDLDPNNIVILKEIYGQGTLDHLDVGRPEDLELYRELYHFVVDNDMADEAHFSRVESMLDIRSYVDYNCMRMYLSDHDWGGRKHFAFWRAREPSDAHLGDGRWRLFTWDFDYAASLSRVELNLLYDATNTWTPNRTALLNNLLENDRFKHFFINRFADHLNTTFHPKRVEAIVKEEYANIEAYLPENLHRWKIDIAPVSRKHEYIAYAGQRPPIQRQHIRDHFNLASEVEIALEVADPRQGHVRLNTIEIKKGAPGMEDNPYPWTGVYFSGIPIQLEAIPAPGYSFSHWEGLAGVTEAQATTVPTQNLRVKAHFTRSNQPVLVYFWLFESSMDNDTPLTEIPPWSQLHAGAMLRFHSALAGYPFQPGHPNWRKASMERRNAPTAVNYRPAGNQGLAYGDFPMRGLQVKQPFIGDGGENALVFHLPTTGYEKPVFAFAAMDEEAASALAIDYALAEEADWLASRLADPSLSRQTGKYTLDFSGIEKANDNPHFRLRIRFAGEAMEADTGNRVTFNNISLEATPLIWGTSVSAAPDSPPRQAVAAAFALHPNSPNPFNAQTTIGYELPAPSLVTLTIYNLLGQPVRTLVRGEQPAGFHQANWDGRDAQGQPLASGVYGYRLTAGRQRAMRRMLLLR